MIYGGSIGKSVFEVSSSKRIGVAGMDGGGRGRRGSGVFAGIAAWTEVSYAMVVSTMLRTTMERSMARSCSFVGGYAVYYGSIILTGKYKTATYPCPQSRV